MKWDSEDERQTWRQLCRDSFWNFFLYAYGAGDNPKGRRWIDPSIHKPICDWFEQHIKEWLGWKARGIYRQKYLAILVPREAGKTTLITQAGSLWIHLHDPDISTYIGSEKTEFAIDFIQSIKQVLDGSDPYSRFTWIYGNWYDNRRVWKSETVVHGARHNVSRKEPSFGVWGVESGLTGKHPDALFVDDLISYEKLASHANWLDTVNNHMTSLIPVLSSDGLMVVVGTRYNDGDHFGTAFRIEGIKTMTGMEIPDYAPRSDGKWDVYFLAAKDRSGNPVIPKVWPKERLADYERKDPLKYAAQVMNDPASSEFNPLTRAQVEQCWVEERHVPNNLRVSVHLDTAFKIMERQSRGDESVIQVWGHSRDQSGDVYYLEGWGSNIWRQEDFAKKLLVIVQKYKSLGKTPFAMTDEMEPGGKAGSFYGYIESYFHGNGNVPVPPFYMLNRGGKKKLSRLITAASYFADGHVKLVRGAPGVERLIEQMTRIGSSAHDDWADCCSDVFQPDVYRPAATKLDRNREDLARGPQDNVLKDGRMSDEEVVKLYDAYFENRLYEVV